MSFCYDPIITINVAGELFQTYDSTLRRYPNSLLGNRECRKQYLNPSTNELYFDRNSEVFESILYFYQSEGNVCNTSFLANDKLIEELEYFGIGEDWIKEYEKENGLNLIEMELPKWYPKKVAWKFLEYPESSRFAQLFAVVSALVTLLTITFIVLETVPNFFHANVTHDKHLMNPNSSNVTIITQYMKKQYGHVPWVPNVITGAIIWFTIEYLIRLIVCPNKVRFLIQLRNWIDIISILPYYTEMFIHVQNGPVLGILRIVRYVNILKLSRFSDGIRILILTLKASSEELLTLSFLCVILILIMASGVYYAECDIEGTKFISIPHSAWWAVVTLSTAGFGDMFPVSVSGKLIGSFALLFGVIMISLPIPTVVTNFTYLYEKEKSRKFVTTTAKEHMKMEKKRQNMRKGLEILIPRAKFN